MEMQPRQKKRMKMDKEVEIESKQLLPDDLVLEIAARCPTVPAIIRFAATSKPIRRGILNAPFLRRLRRFLLSDGSDDGRLHHAFIASLLLGLYHQAEDPHCPPAFVPAADDANYPTSVAALASAPNHDAGDSACDFGPYLPVASRRSFIVLRRRCKIAVRQQDHLAERHGMHPVELSVCNPTTGERCVLPPHDVLDMSRVVLDVDPLPPSVFKLLVAELTDNSPKTLYVQIFSSKEGVWGPALACPITRRCEFSRAGCPRPIVLGDTVHWLCTTSLGNGILTCRWSGEGAVPVLHKTSLVKLPPPYKFGQREMCLAVLPSTDDAAGTQALLSLIVLEGGAIEVWVREKSGEQSTWELWHRIQETDFARPVGFGVGWLSGADLSWFCEGSGTVFLGTGDGAMSPLLLDLDSMVVSKLEATDWERHPEPAFCPYEVDLLSYMLFVMKSF